MIKIFNMMAGLCLSLLCLFALAMEGVYLLLLHYMQCEYGCELCNIVGDITYNLGSAKYMVYVVLGIGAMMAIRFLLKGIEVFFNGNF